MSYSTNLSMPYGAYEMKAMYQRNLLFGNLSILTLVVTVLLVFWVIELLQPEEIKIVGKPPISVITPGHIPQQRSIRVIRESTVPSANELRGAIPVPVPDEEIDEGLDVQIYSQSERAVINDMNSLSDIDINNSVIDTGYYFEDPPPDSFIPTEKIPVMIAYVEPEYPRLCRQAKLEGDVIVKVLVAVDGTVKKAMVARTSKIDSFDKAAVEAAYKNSFTPAIQNGLPIPLWATYTVKFRLK